MPFSRTVQDAILSWWKGTNWTAKATVYVTLLTTVPSDNTGTGLVEMTTSQWTGFARVPVTTTTGFSAISGTSTRGITNAGIIDFGTAVIPGGTVTVTGYAIYDAASAGNLLAYNPLTVSKVINDSDPTQIAIGALTISET